MKSNDTFQCTIGIGIEEHLFVWLFRELDAAPPRIPVSKYLGLVKDLLLFSILDGMEFGEPPITWDGLMYCVRWTDLQGSDGPHCGLKLMYVMGYMYDFLDKQYGGEIPITKAIELMVKEFDPSGEFLRYSDEGGRRSIESTPECTERYGVDVSVPLSSGPDPFDLISTEDEPERLN